MQRGPDCHSGSQTTAVMSASHDHPSPGSDKSARAATIFIHNDAPQALLDCHANAICVKSRQVRLAPRPVGLPGLAGRLHRRDGLMSQFSVKQRQIASGERPMNLVLAAKLDRLREAFELGMSIRRSAQHAGVNKDTAMRYFRLWRMSKEPEVRKPMPPPDPAYQPS
jgi:hypothetical protein